MLLRSFCAQEAVMQFAACLVDVAVRSSTRLPFSVPGETAQNTVEIGTVLEQVLFQVTERVESS